nr:MAG TPA: hypothetical protein [Caudoviricetes sp.]
MTALSCWKSKRKSNINPRCNRAPGRAMEASYQKSLDSWLLLYQIVF